MNEDSTAFRLMNEIGIIAQLGRTALERALPHELTVPQFTVLNHLVRLGRERAPAELARSFQVTKGTMTSTLQRLEAKGFIEIRPDPADGRAKKVAITVAGRTARQESVAAMAPVLAPLEVWFGAEVLAGTLPLLTEIRRFLDESRAGDPPAD